MGGRGGSALVITTAIGLLQSLVITKAGVPSFVVTLAGLLIWNGVVLSSSPPQYSTSGTVRIQDETVVGIANDFLSDAWGLGGRRGGASAPRAGLSSRLFPAPAGPAGSTPSRWWVIALQVAGLALVTGAAVWYANRDRGIPSVTVLVLIMFVLWSFVASRTRFGRHVYAVGGNAEAARRAGINVDRVRIRCS